MEKELKIRTKDGHYIYGTQSFSKRKSDKLVIFVHGFTGHRNEHIFFNGARFFSDRGYDAFRFDLYSHEKGARKFRDTKISQHGTDVTTVARHFRKKYKKLYVIGHSYGGTSLLFADQKYIDAFVFWDASYIEWKEESDGLTFEKNIDAYTLSEGVEHIVGKGFVEELNKFPDCGELVAKIVKPVKFITAGGKGNAKAGKKYFAAANAPKALFEVPGADHCFNSPAMEDMLLEETYSWIKEN